MQVSSSRLVARIENLGQAGRSTSFGPSLIARSISANIMTKKGWPTSVKLRIVIRIDTDTPFEDRFCWPVQDRVRAAIPLTAPRTSPVFSASVSSSSAVRVSRSHAASSPAVHGLSSRFAPGTPSRSGRLRPGGYRCCCCSVGLAGQPPLFPRNPGRSVRGESIHFAAAATGSSSGESGAASFLADWRVIGEQDEQNSAPSWY